MGRLRRDTESELKLFSDTNYYIINPFEFRGNWKNVFKNDNPIHVEVGSGKGGFIFQKAISNPNINFIAIDKFPTILYKLLLKLNKHGEKIKNLKIISMDVKNISEVFSKSEVDSIYLNFSDPWPKKHHEKFRLTSIEFLNKFFYILKSGGTIEFKTDNEGLFLYTMEVVLKNNITVQLSISDLYSSPFMENNTPTEYEIKWINKGAKIKKIILKNK